MAPRPAVPLREIVYTLSPYNQEIVMQGLAKLPSKIGKVFSKNLGNIGLFGTVLFGPIMYASSYKEMEKLESRY